jgi:O-antigen ligase
MPFFMVLLFFLAHLSLTNLNELLRFSYVPFHAVYQSAGLGNAARLSFCISFLYVLFRSFQKNFHHDVLFQAFAWGMNAFIVIVLYYFPTLIISSSRLYLSVQEGEIILPNRLAYEMMLCFYLNLLAYLYTRRLFNKIGHILFCGVSFVFIILTMSRTSLAALLMGLMILICVSKKRFVLVALICLLLTIFSYTFDKNLLFFLSERFTVQQALRDRASGRTEVWSDYLEHATVKDWLMGIGYALGVEAILYQKPLKFIESRSLFKQNASVLKILSTHNMYLQIIFTFGLLGLALTCYFLYNTSKRLLKGVLGGDIWGVYLAIWISFLLRGEFENGFLNKEFCAYTAIIFSQIFKLDGDDVHESRDNDT